jgi:hypothetical protein
MLFTNESRSATNSEKPAQPAIPPRRIQATSTPPPNDASPPPIASAAAPASATLKKMPTK